ncbi:TetR family transcriptional regulator [Lacticaseibacillus sp. GG6-2]
MPKSTFFRLPEAKRDRLIKAAYAEFTRAPFNEASISNIIKDAGIPRGSFYQYFEDKADIFYYLLERSKQMTTAWVKSALDEHHGDLFATMNDLCNRAIDILVEGPYAKFYRNVFMYMDFHSAAKLTPGERPQKPKGEIIQYFVAHIDRENLRVRSDEDVHILVRQLTGLFMQTMGYYYNHLHDGHEVPVQVLKDRTNQMLTWLQYGVAKKEGTHD